MKHDDKLKQCGNDFGQTPVSYIELFSRCMVLFIMFLSVIVSCDIRPDYIQENGNLVKILNTSFSEGKCWIVTEGYKTKERKVIPIDSQSTTIPLVNEIWEIRKDGLVTYFLTRQQSYEKH